MNPVQHLESEKTRIYNKTRNGKYIPGKVYNSIIETFIKNWESKSVLEFQSSEKIPKFTNYYISESNMRCDICIRELWHDMSKILSY